ncbi:MAG TPA: alpha-L-arabinofuranosidase C-terminal domain-containing protein [Mobilitalea sp.]|nr:alpha-L-arabinofuranosidase C-terminal domain-containing protein [Mobilitalea sp.]
MKKVSVLINAKDTIGKIRPEIFGHFSEHLGRCIYDGIYVGEDSDIPNIKGIRKDIIEAFKNIKLPVLRWPGGCFAEDYHWKDGIGPKAQRKKIVNTNWGGVVEDNSFGTHEFMELCRLVGCKPYINLNLGAGTVLEMAEWIEYITSDADSPMANLRRKNGQDEPWKLEYIGIGNENWGCGGNMRPEYYADLYRQYQTFCKNYSGNKLYKIACGPSSSDYNWMEVLMQRLDPNVVNGIDLHYYTMPYFPNKDSATKFDDKQYYDTIEAAYFADELITRHTEIMNRYDPENKIGLIIGEWGCWHEVEPGTNPAFLYQQNTMRNALVAAIELNIFNNHSKRVVMANLAQTVNVLQAIILTEGERMVKTPTYHVFDLYKEHQDATAVYCFVEDVRTGLDKPVKMISGSASVKDGAMTITLSNCSLTEDAEVECDISYFGFKNISAKILTNDARAYNDFDAPDRVNIRDYHINKAGDSLSFIMPPCSIISIQLN